MDEALAWFPGNLRCGAFFHSVSSPPLSQYILSLCVTTTVNSKLLHQSAHYYSLHKKVFMVLPARFDHFQYPNVEGEGLGDTLLTPCIERQILRLDSVV